MARKIFIAGCGRSGTTLLHELMQSFPQVCALPHEAPFSHFHFLEGRREPVHLIKRTWTCHHTLPFLPGDIKLIYCVRHPLDCLTSPHGRTSGKRPYHIEPARWLAEWRSLKRLQRRQSKRAVTFVRYEDLVTDPDAVQARLAGDLDLTQERRFSEVTDIYATSLYKWRNSSERAEYLAGLPLFFRLRLLSFCRTFGYDLPPMITYAIQPRSVAAGRSAGIA